MKVKVDRIENDIVVCENSDGEMINISIKDFKTLPKEGDIVDKKDEKWYISFKDTKERKKYIENLMKNMWKN